MQKDLKIRESKYFVMGRKQSCPLLLGDMGSLIPLANKYAFCPGGDTISNFKIHFLCKHSFSFFLVYGTGA
jgi:hypothetical protein